MPRRYASAFKKASAFYRASKRGRYSRARRRMRTIRRRFTRRVFRAVNRIAEVKYYQFYMDFSTGNFNTSGSTIVASFLSAATPYIYQYSIVNPIPVGNTDRSRVGSRIFVKYVLMTWFFNMTPASAPTTNGAVYGMNCRYGMVLDKRADQTATYNAGPPVSTRELWDTGNGGLFPAGATAQADVPYQIAAFKSINNMNRFKFMLDRQHRVVYNNLAATVAGSATSGTGIVQHFIPVFKTIDYNFTAGTDLLGGAVQKNDLMVYAVPSDSNCCKVSCAIRIAFTDV